MATIYYESDCDPSVLTGKRIAVIGYGSQGHAHALNNQDSGNSVVVGARPDSRAWSAATADGVAVETVADATAQGDIVMVLVPDHVQAGVYRDQIAPNLRPGSMLMFAHGFSIRFGAIEPSPEVDVAMIAPKGPGHLVRRQYLDGHRRAGAGGRPPGRHRQRAGAGAGLRPRPRLCPRRPDRDDLHRGDRDRPVRRAGGALRRHHRSWSRWASRRWSRPATSRRSPTSSACTS